MSLCRFDHPINRGVDGPVRHPKNGDILTHGEGLTIVGAILFLAFVAFAVVADIVKDLVGGF